MLKAPKEYLTFQMLPEIDGKYGLQLAGIAKNHEQDWDCLSRHNRRSIAHRDGTREPMDLQTWWMFVGMTFLVSATPGPNMLLVMSHGARCGMRAAVLSMAGCMSALMCMVSLSAAGVGALLHTWPAVFDALRYAGAAYLAYLGYKLWTSGVPEAVEARIGLTPESVRTAASFYRQGFAVAASNPKAIVFAAAFFPQFIQPERPALLQFGVLLATFTVIEVSWYLIYAASGHKLSRFLQQTHVMKNFNRVTGGVFVGFAGLMAISR